MLCCCRSASTLTAAGWRSRPKTDGSESWTLGQEGSYRCVFEVFILSPGVKKSTFAIMFSQVSSSKSHRASKVLFIGGLKMLLSTGSSPWNHRQVVLWDPVSLKHQSQRFQQRATHLNGVSRSAGVLRYSILHCAPQMK